MNAIIFVLTVLLWSLILPAFAKSLCVTDDLVRTVCIKSPAQRVISLSPGGTELVFASGGGFRLIAIDDYSDFPPEVASIPRIGGYPNVSVEKIAEYKPDLVVAWSGGNSPKVTKRLEALGLTVFYFDPVKILDVASVERRLGALLGTEETANKVAKRFEADYHRLKSAHANDKPVRVFYEIWHEPLMTVSRQQIINQVIELCGGQNIFADAPARIPTVSIESLIALDPQAIISTNVDKSEKSIQERWKDWPELKAVRNGFLFTVDANSISRPGPRILNVVEQLCKHLETVRHKRVSKEHFHSSLNSTAIEE